MTRTVEELATLVNGTVQGDSLRLIDDAASIESASGSAITFVLNENHVSRLKDCKAGAVLLSDKIAKSLKIPLDASLIIVADPQIAFQTVLPLFRIIRGRPERTISPQAHISETAQLGPECHVAAGVTIGEDAVIGANCDLHPGVVVGAGCQIGDNTILHANVVLYHDVQIGSNVIIHSGAVIGADGFGYRFTNGQFEKIPQLGSVRIEDNVEIGACATIDRGAIGPTVIGQGTKIDNLVMVGHNCEIGRHNVFASQAGIAGSSTTGDYVRLAGQAGISDHVRLNTGCAVGAKSGVNKDVPAGETWIGFPATIESEQKRLLVAVKRVPALRDQVLELEKQLASMKSVLEQLQANGSDNSQALPRRAAG